MVSVEAGKQYSEGHLTSSSVAMSVRTPSV